MNEYRLTCERWHINCINAPTNEDDFFSFATDNPNGTDDIEIIATFSTRAEALAELKNYKCSFDIMENYGETVYDLYAVEEIVYDEDGEIENYNFIKYANADF